MIRYLFKDWQKELISAAADAVECCVTSAYLNEGGVALLRRIADRLARLSTSQTQKPIKVLISEDFAPTYEQRNKILFNLSQLPGVQVRVYVGNHILHSKNYIFRTVKDIRVIIGSVNATAGGFFHNIESAVLINHELNDSQGLRIHEEFGRLWNAGKTITCNSEEEVTMHPKFQKGDNVKVISTGKIGTINDVLIRPNTIGYRVTIDGKASAYQEKFLELFIDEEQSILDSVAMGEFGGSSDFRLFETWFRLKRPIEGNFYSYLGSKTIFNPYQFKPLSKFISSGSEERLFIADEVGVGKTIETGIIITELLARGRIDRTSPILIVCPNALGPKWAKEMNKRFNLRFFLHDGNSLKNALLSVLETGRLPDAMMWGIVSIQLARFSNYYQLFEQLSAAHQHSIWSLLIVDEAHHMRNLGTESNSVGNLLSGLSEMVLMLSATPLNLRDEDLFNQMHILNPAMFPDLQTFNALLSPVKSLNRCRRLLAERTIMVYDQMLEELKELESGTLGTAISAHPGVRALRTRLHSGGQLSIEEVAQYDRILISLSPLDSSFTRTLKREAIQHRVTRDPIKVGVVLSQEEKIFHDAVIEMVINAYLAGGGDVRALGFITNMPRRMVSSCIPAMKEYLDWCIDKNTTLIDEVDAKEIVEDDTELEEVALSKELREAYIQLKEQAANLGNKDTKYDEFVTLIKRLQATLDNKQIIVFSFFVRTLKYLQKRLIADGYRVGLICGEIPLTSDGIVVGRYEIMEAFERGEYDILLSSEVGGEGLDFQFCQAIINYDLPYNPMRVEQRIGRIDRFGQMADKVVVGSLFIKDTLDETIYSTLYDRIKLVEDSVGGLEPILGNRLLDVQRDIISGQLNDDEIEVRVKEIELAVAQAKQQMEQFETNRRELMGDEYFTTPLHNLQQKSEFVQPYDVGLLAQICLDRWQGCSYEKLDDNRARFVLSPDKLAKLDLFTRRPGSEGSKDELAPVLKGQFPLVVLFNGSLSDQYRDHVFLPPCGFWTRFLLSEMENECTIARTFAVSLSDHNGVLSAGNYVVPLFEVKLEGFRVEMNLAAVPVGILLQDVIECDYSELSRIMNREAVDIIDDLNPQDVGDVAMFVDIARASLENHMEPKLQELQTENTYRIESRINSLQKGSEVRITVLQKRIDEHRERSLQQGKAPNAEFIRLTEARMVNEKVRTEEKIQSLAGRKDLALSLLLTGIVLLDVK